MRPRISLKFPITVTILAVIVTLFTVISAVTARGDAFEELNYRRSQHNLPPLIEDPFLAECAQLKAEYLAAHQVQGPVNWAGRQYEGHEGPTMGVGYIEGTGQLRSDQGWGTCASTVLGQHKAGAGIAVNKQDGLRYMCLIVEAGTTVRQSGGTTTTSTRDLPDKYEGRPVPAVADQDTSRFSPKPTCVQVITRNRIRPRQYWQGLLPRLLRQRRLSR